MNYKIPELFWFHIMEKLFFTYDGYVVRFKDKEHDKLNRNEFLSYIRKGEMVLIGEV